eukprot:30535-Pelagococcus_subviridis.AAC.3
MQLMQGKKRSTVLALLLLVGILFIKFTHFEAGSYALDERHLPQQEALCESRGCPSVLACITGSWSFEGGRTNERLLYLHVILKNYVGICEAGYTVKVVLLLYSQAVDFEKFISVHNYRCERISASITIQVMYFELRPIPKGAHGSGHFKNGDLAIRHREVFLRHRSDFDVFIVQEDDVSVEASNLDLFRVSLCAFKSSNYYPALYDSEIKNGTRYLSWRFRAGKIMKFGNKTIFQTSHPDWGGRAYIITSYDLRNLVKDPSEWVDPTQVKGEFNPAVASSTWFVKMRNLAVFIDTDEWRGGDIHHLSNRFVHFDPADKYFDMPTLQEVSEVFRSCIRARNVTGDLDPRSSVRFFGDECKACLDGEGTILFTSELRSKLPRRLDVKLECT